MERGRLNRTGHIGDTFSLRREDAIIPNAGRLGDALEESVLKKISALTVILEASTSP